MILVGILLISMLVADIPVVSAAELPLVKPESNLMCGILLAMVRIQLKYMEI